MLQIEQVKNVHGRLQGVLVGEDGHGNGNVREIHHRRTVVECTFQQEDRPFQHVSRVRIARERFQKVVAADVSARVRERRDRLPRALHVAKQLL